MSPAIIIVIVIVTSKFLKRYSKGKRGAPGYSRALRRIRGVVQRSMSIGVRNPVVRDQGEEGEQGGRAAVSTGFVVIVIVIEHLYSAAQKSAALSTCFVAIIYSQLMHI